MCLNSAGNLIYTEPDIADHSKNLPRLGAQALLHTCGAFYPKVAGGKFSKPGVLASILSTPGPKSLLWSVLMPPWW